MLLLRINSSKRNMLLCFLFRNSNVTSFWRIIFINVKLKLTVGLDSMGNHFCSDIFTGFVSIFLKEIFSFDVFSLDNEFSLCLQLCNCRFTMRRDRVLIRNYRFAVDREQFLIECAYTIVYKFKISNEIVYSKHYFVRFTLAFSWFWAIMSLNFIMKSIFVAQQKVARYA